MYNFYIAEWKRDVDLKTVAMEIQTNTEDLRGSAAPHSVSLDQLSAPMLPVISAAVHTKHHSRNKLQGC